MSDHTITFQLATHFLSRMALRLEFLFKTINQACFESHEVIHRFALKSILEIIDIIDKPELKSRFIKELIRIEHVLKKKERLNLALFTPLENQIHALNQVSGKFGYGLHEDNFLRTLRQIYQPNTQECEFNSPHLVLWFDLDPCLRQKSLINWISCLRDLQDTVAVYLSLLRKTVEYIPITALNGFYQHSISPKSVNHLILLRVNKTLGLTPKIQLGHHSLTIRLYELITAKEIHNTSVNMEIAFCNL